MLKRRLHQLGWCNAYPFSAEVVIADTSFQCGSNNANCFKYVGFPSPIASDK